MTEPITDAKSPEVSWLVGFFIERNLQIFSFRPSFFSLERFTVISVELRRNPENSRI